MNVVSIGRYEKTNQNTFFHGDCTFLSHRFGFVSIAFKYRQIVPPSVIYVCALELFASTLHLRIFSVVDLRDIKK